MHILIVLAATIWGIWWIIRGAAEADTGTELVIYFSTIAFILWWVFA